MSVGQALEEGGQTCLPHSTPRPWPGMLCKQVLPGGGRRVGELETWIWIAMWFWAASLDLQRASFAHFRGHQKWAEDEA